MKNLSNLIKLGKGGQGGGKGGGGSVGGGSVEDDLAELDRLMARPIILVEIKAGLVLGTSAPVMLFYDPISTYDSDIFDRLAEYLTIDGKHYYMVYGDTVEECNKNLGAFLKEHSSMIQSGAKPIFMHNEDGLQLGFIGGLAGLLVKKYGLKSKDAMALAQVLLEDGVSFGPGNVREIDLNKIIVDAGENDSNYTSFRKEVDAEIEKELDKILQEVCNKNGGMISVTSNKDKATYETYEVTSSNGTFSITKKAYGGDYGGYKAYLENIEDAGIKHAGTITYATQDKLKGKPHAHHIVMRNDPSKNCESARKSRELLVAYGINPYYAPENLCLALNTGNLRTIEYADQVYARISQETSRAGIIKVLDDIANEIQKNEFPKPADSGTKKTTNSNTKTIPTGKDPLKNH